MIKIQDIVKQLTTEDVIKLVTELGSDTYIEMPDYIQFKTICHNIDCSGASMKLYYYKKDKRFHCYTGCGCSYNLVELFKQRYELLDLNYDFYKDIVLKIAGDQNRNISQLVFPTKYKSLFDKYNHAAPRVEHPKVDPKILNTFSSHCAIEWLQDGISEEAMKIYSIKYDIETNKVIIPHFDENGNLIGIRGRTLNPEEEKYGKYMPITFNDTILRHQLGFNLYGLNLVKNNIKSKGIAIIAEAEKSALQMSTMFGQENNICVASCGSAISSYQIDLLIHSGANKIIIAYDKEGETWNEKDKYFHKLKSICERYKYKVQMGFIYDNQDLLNLKDSPFDRGKETFLKLYKNTIWI